MKAIALFICMICEALGRLVSVLQRNPSGTLALITLLALVVIDAPLLVMMKYLLHG